MPWACWRWINCGHDELEHAAMTWTREQRNAHKRAKYAANREQECKRKREWYAANAATGREYSRRHRAKNGAGQPQQAWSRWDDQRVAKLAQLRAHGRTYLECAVILNSTAEACERAAARYGLPKRKIRKNREPVLAKHVAMHRESEAQAALWRQLLGAAV
jgi:hypothetical protein